MKVKSKSIILGGDLNVDFLTDTKQMRTLSNLMLSYNFKQNIQETTRITSTTATCLDVVFTRFITNFTTKVNDYGLSDHSGFLVSVPIATSKRLTHLLREQRLFTERNVHKFVSELKNVNWYEVINPSKTKVLKLKA